MKELSIRDKVVIFPLIILLILIGIINADEEIGTLGPWRKGDMAYNPTLTDDRPDEESFNIKKEFLTSVLPEKVFKGDNGVFSFRVSPRSENWAGILVMDSKGVPIRLNSGFYVRLADTTTGEEYQWLQRDTSVLFTDASKVALPKTTISVYERKSRKLIDKAVVDFSPWKVQKSTVQMSALIDGPTLKHGFVVPKDGGFYRDGKQMYFWGGHENHIPSKEVSEKYAEVYAEAGINLMRHMGAAEMLKDPVTGEVDPQKMDNYFYLISILGEKGIYFFISCYPGYVPGIYGYPIGQKPKNFSTFTTDFWIDPRYREGWKKFLHRLLTTVNPYTGKALKDDPTIIGFELANETGLNERRFDFNRLDTPEISEQWRVAFNRFLLKKYGSREALAKAWEKNPLFLHEDPAKNTCMVPSNFRGARGPYGGTGQHDQFTTGRWYNNGFGLIRTANPRILDAIEFNNKLAKKTYPFDFNNLTIPKETEHLRQAFNRFLLEKYGDRKELAKAWMDDPLFSWEDASKNTLLIPTNYHGENEYKENLQDRQADPRIGDILEFTYAVQKDWATDMAKFLKEEIGLRCGIGWNGDTFHVVQPPNHKANMDSPLQITITACYQDWDTGDQLTSRIKNLKRFTTYGRIYNRPLHSYEWSAWTRSGPYVYEYILLAGIMGRIYGFDGYSHHKMSPEKYPVSDPVYSLKVHYITPLTDRRRGAFYIARWILERSKIEEGKNRLIVGYPEGSVFTGGPERKMSNPAFENWLLYQLGSDDYSFKDVYDGPSDRIVIHSGHGPYGDYRKAKHAILWCHSNTDRQGKDPKAKEKWFALHGIKFEPGQKYYLNDKYFATTEDMTDYNVVHSKAEHARWALLEKNADSGQFGGITTAEDDYWAPEKEQQTTELDQKLYEALKYWGYNLPFGVNEIDKIWRSSDRTMEMDTTKQHFTADRKDMQVWFGKMAGKEKIVLSKIEVKSDEKQYAVAILPWDTTDFKSAKALVVWTHWNSLVTVKLPFKKTPEIYAVNWLGNRIYKVRPISERKSFITFHTIRDDDIFCYEIVR
jgi:hypothetical protein